jgi:hypothetical protein
LGVLLFSLASTEHQAEGLGRLRPRPIPTPTPTPAKYNVTIEVFEGDPSQGSRVGGATVGINGDRRNTDGAGAVIYQLAAGDYVARLEASGFDSAEHGFNVSGDTTVQLSMSRQIPPPQYFNFVIEVFRGGVSRNRRLPGARVFVDGDTRTSDGNGFTHFWAPSGQRTIRVEAEGFRPFSTTYVIDREHTGQYPSGDRPSFRVPMEAKAVNNPYCTSTTVSDSNSGVPRSLPNMKSVVDRVNNANPALMLNSCREHGGNNDFLFAVVAELRKTDSRWGLNWKRGNIGDMSQDVINYYRGNGPFADGLDTHVVDIIGGHCGPNPVTAWIDVTGVGGALARWTIGPMPKCQ